METLQRALGSLDPGLLDFLRQLLEGRPLDRANLEALGDASRLPSARTP